MTPNNASSLPTSAEKPLRCNADIFAASSELKKAPGASFAAGVTCADVWVARAGLPRGDFTGVLVFVDGENGLDRQRLEMLRRS